MRRKTTFDFHSTTVITGVEFASANPDVATAIVMMEVFKFHTWLELKQ